jgi:hypothetical protein
MMEFLHMRFAAILLLLVPFVALASELDEHLWKKRILVISAPSLSGPLYRAQAARDNPRQKRVAESTHGARLLFSFPPAQQLLAVNGGWPMARAFVQSRANSTRLPAQRFRDVLFRGL